MKPSTKILLMQKSLWTPFATGRNLFKDPESFDSNQWEKINCTILPNITMTPNGNLSADKIVSANTTGAMRPQQTVLLKASTTYTVSAFFKAAEVSWIHFRIAEDGAPVCFFNIANGVIGTRGTFWRAASITRVKNDWFRCTATFTTTGTSYSFRFCLSHDNQITIYTGNGVNGAFIWGAMINEGSSAYPLQIM